MAVGKLCVLGVAFASAQIGWLALLPLAPAGVLIATWRRSFRLLPSAPGDRPVRIREIIRFGIAGASSALYSQSALIISGLMLPVEMVATLTVMLRIIQPAEIVPATLSQQAIPRLTSGRVRLAALTAGFAVIGAVIALGIWMCWPLLENLFGYRFATLAPLAVLLLAVPVKFANYSLTAGLYAADRAGVKTAISVGVGLIVVALVAMVAASDSLLLVACAASAGEALLFVALAAGVIGSSRKIAQS
jgi:O-antigen/teichoic acid export membrane protein